jgi:hypothetical protein
MARPSRLPSTLLLLLLTLLKGIPALASDSSRELSMGLDTWVHGGNVRPAVFPVLHADGSLQTRTTDDVLEADLKVRISPVHPDAFSVSSRNLYWGDAEDSPRVPLRFTFGRRQLDWSGLDSLWNLGIFEPLDQWDRLRPSPQGLTGIFAYTETRTLQLRFFVTGLFIPETAPNIVLRNGRFAPEHPHAITTAPETLNLLNRPTPLGYRIESPAFSKILFRPGFAVSMETRPDRDFHSKLAYAYLPLNHFPVALQAELSIPLDQVQVTLRPRLLHHHLYSADASIRAGAALLGLSALVDEPAPEQPGTDETAAPLTTSTWLAPWIRWAHGSLHWSASHLLSYGGIDPDRGPFATPGASLFSSRILYRNATVLALRWMPEGSAIRELRLQALHEWSIRGDWFSADLGLPIGHRWIVTLGGDLLSSWRDSAPGGGAEFLADLRPLGRARIGVQCVF